MHLCTVSVLKFLSIWGHWFLLPRHRRFLSSTLDVLGNSHQVCWLQWVFCSRRAALGCEFPKLPSPSSKWNVAHSALPRRLQPSRLNCELSLGNALEVLLRKEPPCPTHHTYMSFPSPRNSPTMQLVLFVRGKWSRSAWPHICAWWMSSRCSRWPAQWGWKIYWINKNDQKGNYHRC